MRIRHSQNNAHHNGPTIFNIYFVATAKRWLISHNPTVFAMLMSKKKNLVATKQLYKSVCPFVGPSVGLYFSDAFAFWQSCRVYGLV